MRRSGTPFCDNFMIVNTMTIKLQWSVDTDFYDSVDSSGFEEPSYPHLKISSGGLITSLGDTFRKHDLTPNDGAWYRLDINTEVSVT